MAKAKRYKRVAVQYAKDVVAGVIIAGREVVQACQRFLDDLERPDLTLRTKEPDFVIGIIEKLMVHNQGEDLNGRSLINTPLLLQPWQIFVVYNLIGFYRKGARERRFKEAFIFVPRKNGKTLSQARRDPDLSARHNLPPLCRNGVCGSETADPGSVHGYGLPEPKPV